MPADFRFIVKAPASVTDAVVRGERGVPAGDNPAFLNAQIAIDEFVRPCIDGLGAKAGALVFQFSPLPDAMIVEPARFIDRLSAFLRALPPLEGESCYAVELRDAVMLDAALHPRAAGREGALLHRRACAHARAIGGRRRRSRCSMKTASGR